LKLHAKILEREKSSIAEEETEAEEERV